MPLGCMQLTINQYHILWPVLVNSYSSSDGPSLFKSIALTDWFSVLLWPLIHRPKIYYFLQNDAVWSRCSGSVNRPPTLSPLSSTPSKSSINIIIRLNVWMPISDAFNSFLSKHNIICFIDISHQQRVEEPCHYVGWSPPQNNRNGPPIRHSTHCQ